MKKLIAILILILCTTVYAAVSLTITVPDIHVPTVLSAMNKLTDMYITLEAGGSITDPRNEFSGRWDFRIAPKDPNETNKQFADRFTKELLRASVRVVKSYEEHKRYRTDIGAIEPVDVNVPDGIIE
jgi:hypothetical protein